MIQFNLLPDVKLEYIKAKRVKRVVVVIASMITVLSLTIFVALFVLVNFVNKKRISDISTDISKASKKITDTPDINKILTVQNQLNNLTQLHNDKPVATRLNTFMQQVTPSDITVAKLEVNFVDSTVSVNGSAATLSAVNQFIDTLKFTDYKTTDVQERAFSEVVLDSFDRNSKEATYTIKLKFNPAIFKSDHDVSLVVPNRVTTRSAVETESLFKPTAKVETK